MSDDNVFIETGSERSANEIHDEGVTDLNRKLRRRVGSEGNPTYLARERKRHKIHNML